MCGGAERPDSRGGARADRAKGDASETGGTVRPVQGFPHGPQRGCRLEAGVISAYDRSGAQRKMLRPAFYVLHRMHAERRSDTAHSSFLLQAPPGALLLQLDHAAVEPALCHQLCRRALLCDAAVGQHDDLIGRFDSAHPVGDHQNGLAGKQAGKRALHFGFVFHIQAGGGLVQQDDRGVFQERPGDRDPLPLAAGELGAVFADGRVVACGQFLRELIAVCSLGCGEHFGVGGAVLAEADVLHHRVVKQDDVLKHHGVIGEKHLRVHGGDIDAADLDRAAGDVPQPCGKPRAGALAGAGWTDQRRDLAFLGGEAHVAQNFLLVVGETDVLEYDVVPLGGEGLGALRGRGVVDLQHAVGGYLRDEYFRDEREALVKGRVNPRDDQQEQEQDHKIDVPGKDQAGSRKDGGRYAEAHDHTGGIDKDSSAELGADHDPLVLVDFPVQPFEISLLLIGGADLPHVFQRLLNAVRNGNRGLFRPFGAAAADLAAAEQQPKGNRDAPKAGDCQPPVVHEQADSDDRRGDVRAVQIPEHMGPDVLHAVDVAHQSLGQIGQIALAEVAQRQLAQPLRKAEARRLDFVVHQSVGGLILLQVGREREDDEQHHHPDGEHCAGQGRTVRQGIHKAGHHYIQDAGAAHDDQIDDDRPECALFRVAHALIGQGVFPLKLLAEHLLYLLFAGDLPLDRAVIIGPHPRIQPACCGERRVCALLGDAPGLQYEDLICANDGGKAVGDHNDGSATSQRGKGFLDQHFVFRVGKGGGLVQYDDGGILEDRAGQRDALLLAAGKVGALGADLCVDAVRQLFQNVAALGGRQRGEHLFPRGFGAGDAHILKNRGLKQAVVLKDEGHLIHEHVGIDAGHVYAADLHRARGRVPEAGDQAGRGGLAASGRPYQRHGLARFRREGNMGEGGHFRAVIGKAHILEFHPVALRCQRVLGRLQRGRFHDLADAAQRRAGQHHAGGGKHDLGERRGDDGGEYRVESEICDKAGKIAAGQSAGRQKQRGGNEEHERALRKGQIDRLWNPAHFRLVVLGLAAVLLDGLLKRLKGIHRLLEDLHDRDTADILGARLGHAVLRGLIRRHQMGVFAAHHEAHCKHRDHRCQQAGRAHPPVKDEHQRQHGDEKDDCAHNIREVVGKQRFSVGGRRVKPAADQAGGVGVEEAERGPHHVGDALLADVGRRAERRKMGAHQAREIDHNAAYRKGERQPPVLGDVLRLRPRRRDGDQVPGREPDADVRRHAQQHGHR